MAAPKHKPLEQLAGQHKAQKQKQASELVGQPARPNNSPRWMNPIQRGEPISESTRIQREWRCRKREFLAMPWWVVIIGIAFYRQQNPGLRIARGQIII